MTQRIILVSSMLLASVAALRAEETSPNTGRIVTDDQAADILDVFPSATFRVDEAARGTTRLSSDFTPSGSLWLKGLREQTVFQQEIVHEQDRATSYRLRIGRGGQIYSLRGSFGESVPPSWRSGGKLSSPWNDEVWQFVAVCSKYNGQPQTDVPGTSFFVHNSGIYVKSAAKPLYCPVLAQRADPERRAYRMLNWGLIAESPSVHRSPLLYYLQVRDAGAGVVELTWVVHNFSNQPDVVFDFVNAPWGGSRWTSLPYCYWSTPDGKPIDVTNTRTGKSQDRIRRFDQLGGWILRSVRRNDPASPALGLVFGRDRHLGSSFQSKASIYRGYRAHPNTYEEGKKPNEHRNYDVVEVIPKCQIAPGDTYFFRVYIVVDRFDRAITRCNELVGHVNYGPLRFDRDSVSLVSVTVDEDSPVFSLYARPVPNSRPLLLLEDTETGQRIVSTDPYLLCGKRPFDHPVGENHPLSEYFEGAEYHLVSDGRTRWLGMVGYGLIDRPQQIGAWRRLSTLFPDRMVFPEPDANHLDLWVRIGN